MDKNNIETEEIKRVVVKYSTTQNTGVKTTQLTSNTLGLVIRGEKQIHEDDRATRITAGDIFFLAQGRHYVENIPARNDSYEQIVLHFSPERLQKLIASLNISSIEISTNSAKGEKSQNFAVARASKITRNIFYSINRHFELGGFRDNDESENLFLLNLVHSIVLNEHNSVRDALLNSLDLEKATFERVIYDNLLVDKSIGELAEECSKSLTSFKKEFRQLFGAPPHQWYLRQRLNYAKILLNTTREPISQIGQTCAFPNTSHFIKLFKRHFGDTPASYRSSHNENQREQQSELEEIKAMTSSKSKMKKAEPEEV
ncbi:MAG: AraC family transcriptional regulator [Rikenellaceae bacterium]